MHRNFSIKNSVILTGNGFDIDLHNDFKLISITIDIQNKELALRFTKETEHWIKNSDPKYVTLLVSELSFFRLSDHLLQLQSIHIEDIGFKAEVDYDHDWLIQDEHAIDDLHLVIRFADDEYIRTYGGRLELLLSNESTT